MGLEMNSDHRPRLILWDFVTVWRRLPLNAIRRAMPIIAKEAGAGDEGVSIEGIPGRRMVLWWLTCDFEHLGDGQILGCSAPFPDVDAKQGCEEGQWKKAATVSISCVYPVSSWSALHDCEDSKYHQRPRLILRFLRLPPSHLRLIDISLLLFQVKQSLDRFLCKMAVLLHFANLCPVLVNSHLRSIKEDYTTAISIEIFHHALNDGVLLIE